MVASVLRDSPAEMAGLRCGDVIVRYNGADIATPENLIDLVKETGIGNQVEIQYIRGGALKAVVATIEAKK